MTPAAWMLGERRGEGEEKLLCGEVFKREAAAIAAADRMTCHWRTVRAVPVYAEQLARPAPPPSWRCFFCDEEFLDRAAAAQHFGADEDCEPACRIKASEGGLIKALRDTEEALFDATARLHAESGEVFRTWAAVGSRYEAALRSAEEAGFERGLRDSSVADGFTYALLHNPNCPSPYLVRLTRGVLDMLDLDRTADAIGYGLTFLEAFAAAKDALEAQR